MLCIDRVVFSGADPAGDSSVPGGWGWLMQLACLLLAVLLALLYVSSVDDGYVYDFSAVAVAAPIPVSVPVSGILEPGEAGVPVAEPVVADVAAAAAPVVSSAASSASLVSSLPASSLGEPSSAVASSAPTAVVRYVNAGSDVLAASVWRQRAIRAAELGDYALADDMYSQAMGIVVSSARLFASYAVERAYWLRRSGRGYAADSLLRRAGVSDE